jgi:hypothetical protein
VLNLSDTLDVVRVRFAKKEDAKMTDEELKKHKITFNEETGELDLERVLKKVPEEQRYSIKELATKHYKTVVNEEKRYFPSFRKYEETLKDFKQSAKDYINLNCNETQKKLNNDFVEKCTGESYTELRSLCSNLFNIKPDENGLKNVLNNSIKTLINKEDDLSKKFGERLEGMKRAIQGKKAEESLVKLNPTKVFPALVS